MPYPDKVKNGLSSNGQLELHSLQSKPTSAGVQLTKKVSAKSPEFSGSSSLKNKGCLLENKCHGLNLLSGKVFPPDWGVGGMSDFVHTHAQCVGGKDKAIPPYRCLPLSYTLKQHQIIAYPQINCFKCNVLV